MTRSARGRFGLVFVAGLAGCGGRGGTQSIAVTGTLHAGSGSFIVSAQPHSGPGFALLFSGPGGAALPSILNPRLNVLRLR